VSGVPPAAIPEQSQGDESGTINTVKMLGGISPERKDSNMKTITKTIMYLQMTALLLTAALAGSAAAEKEVPFRGSIQGFEIAEVQFPSLFVDGSGSGNATHLGRFTLTYELEVDFLTHETFGSSVFTAANGDSLSTDITGFGTPTENPDVHSIVEVHTITGGTGRFAGARGNFIRTYLLNLVTGVTSGSFDGTIVLPEAE
jgi:hypothetical protein